jgi:hypothetical protein
MDKMQDHENENKDGDRYRYRYQIIENRWTEQTSGKIASWKVREYMCVYMCKQWEGTQKGSWDAR